MILVTSAWILHAVTTGPPRQVEKKKERQVRVLTSVASFPLDAILTTSRWRSDLTDYLLAFCYLNYLLRACRTCFSRWVASDGLVSLTHWAPCTINLPYALSFVSACVAYAPTDRAQLTLPCTTETRRTRLWYERCLIEKETVRRGTEKDRNNVARRWEEGGKQVERKTEIYGVLTLRGAYHDSSYLTLITFLCLCRKA